MAQKKVCPRDEMIADPPGTNVFPIDRHGFADGFVSFRACVVCSRRRLDLLGIAVLSAVSSQGRQGERNPVFLACVGLN